MWLNRWHNLVPRYMLGTAMVAALVGCVSPAPPTAMLEPSLMDQSILTDVPCAAPCWYKLELGKSTKSDALTTAQTLSFIDPEVFPETPEHYLYLDGSKREYVDAFSIRLFCRQPKEAPCADLLFVNDTLKQIYVFLNHDLSFGEVAAHLGEPDYIRFVPNSAEGPGCDIALVWRQRGIIVYHYGGIRCDKAHKDQRVDKNVPVQLIMYMLPENYVLAVTPETGLDFPWAGFLEP